MKRERWALGAFSAALLAGRAIAVPMAYQFAGVIDSVWDPAGLLGGSVSPGTEFSGVFTFDSDAEDSNFYPDLGEFTGPAFSMAAGIGPNSWFSEEGNGRVNVHNSVIDILAMGTEYFSVDGGLHVRLGATLSDTSGVALSSDALPIEAPFPFSAFDATSFWVKGHADADSMELVGDFLTFRVVPEPSSVLIIVFALGLMQWRHR